MDRELILNTEVRYLTAAQIHQAVRLIDAKLNNSRHKKDQFLLSRQSELLREQKRRTG
jgi:hypothetical protein